MIMIIGLVATFIFLFTMFIYVATIYDVPTSHIPETESEKYIRDLKMRIADAEWKFNKELDKHR